MQDAHEGHHHDSPRLRRALILAALSITPLPSPIAPLSPSPPLANGAFASRDSIRHLVDARTTVRVFVDQDGTAFKVTARQRLDVRRQGDYFFTIGAPLLDVSRAPGSESEPGLRATSILWAGFDPGRRILAADAVLDPVAVRSSLPARIEVRDGRRFLVNTTGVDVAGFTADARPEGLRRYLDLLRRSLRRGGTPVSGAADLTSAPVGTTVHVTAPLAVRGTVGSARISSIVTGRLQLPATGRIDLTVDPVPPAIAHAAGDSGRTLLARAVRASLTAARTRQYETFLGNPDPTGKNETAYAYVSARRPVAAPPAAASSGGRDRTVLVLWLVGVLAALAAAATVWARS